MKPVNFEIARASTLTEASQLLFEAAGDGKLVAGGQSLGPMLNLRLVQPRLLIDISGIPEMTRVENEGDALTLGACVTTAAIEDRCLPIDNLEMLPRIAEAIAYRAVRNRGTIGGSVCHADPAADWISTLVALEADCVVSSPTGQYRVPLHQFVTSAYEVALEEGQILEAIRIPRPSRHARWGYEKICRKTGEFAMAIGAVLIDPEHGRFRGVIGATAGPPIIVDLGDRVETDNGCPTISPDDPAIANLFAERGTQTTPGRGRHIVALNRAIAQAFA